MTLLVTHKQINEKIFYLLLSGRSFRGMITGVDTSRHAGIWDNDEEDGGTCIEVFKFTITFHILQTPAISEEDKKMLTQAVNEDPALEAVIFDDDLSICKRGAYDVARMQAVSLAGVTKIEILCLPEMWEREFVIIGG